jgi:hypothetical protein
LTKHALTHPYVIEHEDHRKSYDANTLTYSFIEDKEALVVKVAEFLKKQKVDPENSSVTVCFATIKSIQSKNTSEE